MLIPACIGINYLGKLIASLLKLPLWLDSIGTCIGACLGGPIIGAICGAVNNLVFGLTTGDNITLIYALTSLGIGLVVGIMARLGFMKTFVKALLTACAGGLAAVVISTPLNVIFWGGTTGNVWGDALFAWTQAKGMPVMIGSFLDELVVDVPDKILTIIIVFIILAGLPPTIAHFGTDLVITLPIAIIAPSSIFTPGYIILFAPIQQFLPIIPLRKGYHHFHFRSRSSLFQTDADKDTS